MIKIENVETYGWEAAVRGMRNPMNSWDKSDSWFWIKGSGLNQAWGITENVPDLTYGVHAGEKDLNLMKNLSHAGNDHGKFLRMITVTVDITAPLYWFKEFDTYKVGTVANSCSTMHKIHAKPFEMDDFSHEHLSDHNREWVLGTVIINQLNKEREHFLDSKDKDDWWQMIQLLPSSYNQKRTVQMNYAVLKNMYHARKNHKLDEWREFCKWCETLPYFKEICIDD